MGLIMFFFKEPQVFLGHEDNIRHAVFSSMDGNNFVSCSDDNTVRFWDKRTSREVSKLNFNTKANGIEINADKSILSICFGPNIMFYDLKKRCEIRTFKAPTTVYTSSLHPDKNVFVFGGEDFIVYKYDFNTLEQIGKKRIKK